MVVMRHAYALLFALAACSSSPDAVSTAPDAGPDAPTTTADAGTDSPVGPPLDASPDVVADAGVNDAAPDRTAPQPNAQATGGLYGEPLGPTAWGIYGDTGSGTWVIVSEDPFACETLRDGGTFGPAGKFAPALVAYPGGAVRWVGTHAGQLAADAGFTGDGGDWTISGVFCETIACDAGVSATVTGATPCAGYQPPP